MKLPTLFFILFYIVCSPTLTLGFKFLFSNLDFHFPLSTVNVLLLFEWFLAATIRPFFVSEDERCRVHEGGTLFQKYSAILVGLCLAAELAFSNMSLLTLSVSFHTMVKSATPAYVLLFSTLFGLEKPNLQLVIVVGIIIIGIALCSLGEIQFAFSGFLFVCLSSMASGMRWAVSHLYLSSRETTSPIELLFKSLPASFLVLPLFCAIVEYDGLKEKFSSMSVLHMFYLFSLLVMFAGLGFVMVFVELSLVKRISSLSFSILAVFKESLVVALSIVLNHDDVDLFNSIGFVLTLFGVLCFKYIRQEHHILHDEFANPDEEAETLTLTSRRKGLFSNTNRNNKLAHEMDGMSNSSSINSSLNLNGACEKLNVVVQSPSNGLVNISGGLPGVHNPLLQEHRNQEEEEPL